MYLLDTNVISELRKAKSHKHDKNVTAWVKNIPISSLFLSVITIFELELGILKIERRDLSQGNVFRTWLNKHIFPNFSKRILPIDIAIAKRCAILNVPNLKSERDGFIAATALVHGLIMVTRNVKDFNQTGVEILNPWKS